MDRRENYASYRVLGCFAGLLFLAGVRDVIFPAGTYWLRVHFAVRCAKPP